MGQFQAEFRSLQYVIKKANKVLLFAHTRPDGDTVGATLALKEYLVREGKRVDIACFDVLPERIGIFFQDTFVPVESLRVHEYDVCIACDSVDRGFAAVKSKMEEKQVSVLIDHHPGITLEGDIVIIEPKKSSTSELLFDYLEFVQAELTPRMATALLMGLVFDTGNFQHSSTTPRVMEIASVLMRRGASLAKVVDLLFTHDKVAVLKLWGRAFTKAKICQENGMIVSALTKKDLEECSATAEDVYYVVSILNTVPGTKFSLVLFERENGIIKGQLRSDEHKGVDVSEIARAFGGGGHRFASGFEVSGRIQETALGWEIL